MHTERVLLFCVLEGAGPRCVQVKLAKNEMQPSFLLQQLHVRHAELVDSLWLLRFNSTLKVAT